VPPTPPGTVPPPPPYGAPPPPAAPPKKSNALKIVLIVLAVLVVLCIGGVVAGAFLLRNVVNQFGYNVGNCLDEMPVSEFQTEYNGVVVPCDSPEAVAKIVAVHEVDDVQDALDNADTLCANAPGYVASVGLRTGSGSGGRLLCLAEN
jgi:hypothetical protein